jgi:hypothetical protein
MGYKSYPPISYMNKWLTLTLTALIGCVLPPHSFAQSAYPYAINTVAGQGALGDGGPAISALLEFPRAAVADTSGNIYIGDAERPHPHGESERRDQHIGL